MSTPRRSAWPPSPTDLRFGRATLLIDGRGVPLPMVLVPPPDGRGVPSRWSRRLPPMTDCPSLAGRGASRVRRASRPGETTSLPTTSAVTRPEREPNSQTPPLHQPRLHSGAADASLPTVKAPSSGSSALPCWSRPPRWSNNPPFRYSGAFPPMVEVRAACGEPRDPARQPASQPHRGQGERKPHPYHTPPTESRRRNTLSTSRIDQE